jgi:hypothetical protein
MDRWPRWMNLPTSRLRQRLGAVLLGAVIVTVIVAQAWPTPNTDDLTVVNGYGGALKVSFLNDPAVAEILEEKYGLRVHIEERGSIELACGKPLGDDVDFVWLGDSVAVARYTDRGCTMLRADNVYNSPIVLYSWTPVVDALVEAGVAESTADGAHTIDFAHLVDLMMAGTTWADIGLPQLHGKIIVQTTDPARSNSGLLFAGMLANTLNGGDVVNTTTVGPLLPDIQAYFQRLGLMQPTSGDMFEQFLITGMGAKPIVALYESQIQEFLVNNPSYRDQIQQQVRILYPQPTVWATHPLVARSDGANRLLTALKDHDIQRLAWEMHGQRPGVPQVVVDPDVIPITGILRQVPSVTSMPGPEPMDRILEAIAAPPDSATPQSATAPFALVGSVMLAGRSAPAIPGRRHRSPRRGWTKRALLGGRAATRNLVLLAALVGVLAPSAIAAQPTLDVTVVWTDPFEQRTGLSAVPGANHETILVHEDSTVVVANGTFAAADARLAAFEVLGADSATLINVDASPGSDPQYWLDLFTIAGTPYGAFTLARTVESGITMTAFLAPVTTFASGLTQAQGMVLVDLAPIFEGVEPAGLQTLLEAETPNLDDEGAADTDSTPAGTEESPDAGDAFADYPGMTGVGEYGSPHHGFALTWTDAWVLDPAYEAPVVSDVNFDFDEVHLTVNSPQWVWFGFYAGELLPGDSFEDIVDRSASEWRLELEIGPSAEVIVSRIGVNADGVQVGALIIRVSLEGYEFLVYEEYRASDDGSVATLQLLMHVDDVEPGLQATESLELDGGPIITLFTPDEIISVAQSRNVL